MASVTALTVGSQAEGGAIARMMGELASAVCVLAIVILGVLVMTGTIAFEQLLKAVGRFLLTALGTSMALCFLRTLLISVIVPRFLSLKATFFRLALAALAIIALALIVRIAVSKLQR